MTATVIRTNKQILSNPNFVYIGRHVANKHYNLPQSKWHNPYLAHKYNKDGSIKKIRHGTIEEVVAMYQRCLLANTKLMACISELKDKILGCWCKVRYPTCHGDVLMRLANSL